MEQYDDARVGTGAARAMAERPTGTIQGQAARLPELIERIHRIANAANATADRAFGERPETNVKGQELAPRTAPPYGGAAADLHYGISTLEDAVTAAERAVGRLDSIA